MHHQTASGYELLQYALFALQWRKQDDHQNYQNSAAQRSSVVIADENQCNHEYHQKLVILMKNTPIMDEPTPESRSILRMTLTWPVMCVDVWSSLCPLRIYQLSCWPLAWWSPRVFTLRRSCWPKGPWIERQTTLGEDSTTNFERLVVLDSAGNDRLCCDLAASVHLNDFVQFVHHYAESAS